METVELKMLLMFFQLFKKKIDGWSLMGMEALILPLKLFSSQG